MIDQILSYADKLGKLLSVFKVSMIVGVFVNLAIIIVLFKLTDIFIHKLHQRFKSNENAASFVHIFPILEKIIKFLIVFLTLIQVLVIHIQLPIMLTMVVTKIP